MSNIVPLTLLLSFPQLHQLLKANFDGDIVNRFFTAIYQTNDIFHIDNTYEVRSLVSEQFEKSQYAQVGKDAIPGSFWPSEAAIAFARMIGKECDLDILVSAQKFVEDLKGAKCVFSRFENTEGKQSEGALRTELGTGEFMIMPDKTRMPLGHPSLAKRIDIALERKSQGAAVDVNTDTEIPPQSTIIPLTDLKPVTQTATKVSGVFNFLTAMMNSLIHASFPDDDPKIFEKISQTLGEKRIFLQRPNQMPFNQQAFELQEIIRDVDHNVMCPSQAAETLFWMLGENDVLMIDILSCQQFVERAKDIGYVLTDYANLMNPVMWDPTPGSAKQFILIPDGWIDADSWIIDNMVVAWLDSHQGTIGEEKLRKLDMLS